MTTPSPFASDPYAPPSAFGTGGMGVPSGNQSISPAMVDSFRRTRGWVMFFAVLSFIFTGLCALVAVAGSVMPTASASPVSGPALAAIYAVLMVLYAVSGWQLRGYASALGQAAERPETSTAEAALESGRKVWALFGIVTIGLLVITFGAFVVGVVAGLANIGAR